MGMGISRRREGRVSPDSMKFGAPSGANDNAVSDGCRSVDKWIGWMEGLDISGWGEVRC